MPSPPESGSEADAFQWILHMQTSADYLGIEKMEAGMAYSIWARNAFVGIWLPAEQGFLISRYKLSPTPYLFVEYHWDTGEPLGTVKPLRPLEICPLDLPPETAYHDDRENAALCGWLDDLETRCPPLPLPGWDPVKDRREAGMKWLRRQEMQRALKREIAEKLFGSGGEGNDQGLRLEKH